MTTSSSPNSTPRPISSPSTTTSPAGRGTSTPAPAGSPTSRPLPPDAGLPQRVGPGDPADDPRFRAQLLAMSYLRVLLARPHPDAEELRLWLRELGDAGLDPQAWYEQASQERPSDWPPAPSWVDVDPTGSPPPPNQRPIGDRLP